MVVGISVSRKNISLKRLERGLFVSTLVTEARVRIALHFKAPSRIISCCCKARHASEESEMRGEVLLGLHRWFLHLMFLFSKHCFEHQTCVVSKRSSEDDRNGSIFWEKDPGSSEKAAH